LLCFFSLIIPHPPRSTLFPYTTLFRSITHEDIIELRLLSQRMIFIAGENVLVAFNKFVIRFVRLAKNEKISEKDLDDLLDEMSMVSVEIRNDILDNKTKQDMDVQSFEKLILKTNELMDFSDN